MENVTGLVLGGGVGGVVAARTLRRLLPRERRVALVERSQVHVFQPSLPWVFAGTRRPEGIRRSYDALRRRGIEVVAGEVEELDAERRRVRVGGGWIGADGIVVALGAELHAAAVPGLAEAGHDVYTLGGSIAARRALDALERGRLVVLVAAVPFKCPAAPYEIALLADHALRRRGVRSGVEIAILTPEPGPMPTAGPAVSDALRGMIEARGIAYRPQVSPASVDAAGRRIRLAADSEEAYDLLLYIPPHRAPAAVRASPLAAETGWATVDPRTLATKFDGIWAIGDVATIPLPSGRPLPKAGVFAERQALAVARSIADRVAGREPSGAFDGRGECFIEVGGGRAGFGGGDFYASPVPVVRLHPPARRWHWGKVLFEKGWLWKWL